MVIKFSNSNGMCCQNGRLDLVLIVDNTHHGKSDFECLNLFFDVSVMLHVKSNQATVLNMCRISSVRVVFFSLDRKHS